MLLPSQSVAYRASPPAAASMRSLPSDGAWLAPASTEQINAHRTEVAGCRGFEAAAHVFWPPLRGTFLPNTPRPAQPLAEGAIAAESNKEEEPEG